MATIDISDCSDAIKIVNNMSHVQCFEDLEHKTKDKEDLLTLAETASIINDCGSETQNLRNQCQRLLMLRHAFNCPRYMYQCSVTSHCWEMKTLLIHVLKCTNNTCQTRHCFSSRYVLEHFAKCTDLNCGVCGPTRCAVEKSFLGRTRKRQRVDSFAMDSLEYKLPL